MALAFAQCAKASVQSQQTTGSGPRTKVCGPLLRLGYCSALSMARMRLKVAAAGS